jgi:ribonuclease HII
MKKANLSAVERLCNINTSGTAKLQAGWFQMLQTISTSTISTIKVGIDEVGRGSIFGPMVVAATANLSGWTLGAIRDSKLIKCSAIRKQLADEIRHNLVWAVIVVPPKAINEFGTLNTLLYAGRRVREEIIKRLSANFPRSLYHVIYDGRDHPRATEGDVRIESIEKADATIFEVSCASILAKATHDGLIEKLCEDPNYARYDLINHRGYGTPKHEAALRKYGPCDLHRKVATATLLTEPTEDETHQPAGRGRQPANHTDGTGRIARRRAARA